MLVRMSGGEKESLYTIDGNINYSSHCGIQYGGFFKKKNLKIGLPCDTDISLLAYT
jgi:hypothetical protein